MDSDLAAAYIRYSTDRQTDSEATQRAVISEHARAHGFAVVEWYVDEARSGGSVEGRAELLRLLADARKHLWRVLLLYKLDRAFRNLEEQIVAVKELRRLGVRIVAVRDPDMEGTSGELVTNLLGAVNQFERRLIGERVRDSNRTRAQAGRWTSGGQPFGYRYDVASKSLVVVPDEADIIRAIFARYLETESANAVARDLREQGARTRAGTPWSVPRVLRVLRSPVYAGYVTFGRKASTAEGRRMREQYDMYDGSHEALVGRQEWGRAQAIRAANWHGRRKPSAGYPLGGLLRCALCGQPATGAKDHGSLRSYRCRGRVDESTDCKGWRRSSRRLEEAVFGALIANIDDVGGATLADSPARKTAVRRSTKVDVAGRRSRLLEMREAGLIGLEELRDRLAALRDEPNEAPLAEAADPSVLEEICDLRGRWPKMTDSERGRLLRAYIALVKCDGAGVTVRFRAAPLAGWMVERRTPLRP